MSSKYFGKALIILLHIIFFLLILSSESITADEISSSSSIGAIIDEDSRIGKEQKAGMKIAVHNFNTNSAHPKLSIHFQNTTSGNPLQAATAANKLIKGEKVQVIVGAHTWEEAAIVADVANQTKVAVISLAATAISPPFTHERWPFLVQMASSSSKEMEGVAAIVHSYNWRKVIVIYEDDAYGDPATLAVLSQVLQEKGTEIEYRLVLPPFSSLSDPQLLISQEVTKLLSMKSRVFIVLQSSFSVAKHLFREAKRIGLMGTDSVWIITDSVSSLLDSGDPSFLSCMEGAIGTKSYYPEETSNFTEFRAQFREIFRSDYPGEDSFVPGIHALRAYDSIMAISQAVTRLGTDENTNSVNLLKGILSSDFQGLSGKIRFSHGTLVDSSTLRIINVVGKSYKELGFWSPESRFSRNMVKDKGNTASVDTLAGVGSLVNWPGDISRVPKGWAMASDAKPMRIGVPGRTVFQKFVKFELDDPKHPTGFCIDVFKAVVKVLEESYPFPSYEFIAFNGTYDELVFNVTDQGNMNFDAVVGDVTILANRSKYVEFTQPFAESGLSMLVQYIEEDNRAWMFMKPFTNSMWIATFAILFYTMFIVWFMEHQTNPEFKGQFKDQLGTAFWFTFSSLFFAHREKVYSNFTKTVVVVWLFVVLVLTSSYTASLSSLLTVQRLEPKVKDIEWIKKTNATVGCDGDSFVKDYLRNVLKLENIKTINNESDYPSEFQNGSISASFLELPYQKVFLQEYCNQYTPVGPTYRFGGLGFVFQKGSPLARDVSEAILTISENGVLKGLERYWFYSSTNCSASTNTDSLTLGSFWGIYLLSGVTSTVCLLIFIVKLQHDKKNKDQNQINRETEGIQPGEGNRKKASSIVFFRNNSRISPVRAPSYLSRQGTDSSRWELVSPSEAVEHHIRPTEIEIQEQPARPTDIQIPMPNLDNIVKA